MSNKLLNQLHNEAVDMSLLEHVTCNLCQGQDFKLLYTISNLTVVKCRQCNLIFVNPRLKKDTLQEMYESDYFHRKIYDPNSKGFYGYVNYLSDKKNIIKTFENVFDHIETYKKEGKVLDVGCAFGFFLDLAREKGWEVTGTELSSNACLYARNELNLKVHQKTLSEAVLPEGDFDLVTMFDVIEHLPDPMAGLCKINRSLKHDGLLAVTTADADSLLARILGPKLEDVRRINEHLYVFSRRTITGMLKKSGFKILKIKTTGKFFSLSDLFERLTLYHPRFFKGLKFISEKLKLHNLTVYVNPGVKITVFAKKIKEAKQTLACKE